MKGKLYAV